MNTDYLTRLLTFTEDDLPDLDEVVLGALAYLEGVSLPTIDVTKHARPLVVGSGNASRVGKILFRDVDSVCIEEASFSAHLSRGVYDAVYLISASGEKHAIDIAEAGERSGLPTYLITTREDAPAAKVLKKDHVFVFPHIREPYTYNTSTYLSMLLGTERTSPTRIRAYIEEHIEPMVPTFGLYRAFLITVPPEFKVLRGMFETKFHELFGPHLTGNAFTTEEVKHAKTVVTSSDQCFICFGPEVRYGTPGFRLHVPLPDDITHGELIALGYYLIGKIQKAHRPYFKEHISVYVKEATRIFGHDIPVIVE